MDSNTSFILKYRFSILLSIVVAVLMFLLFGFYWMDSERIVVAILQGGLFSPPYEAWFDEALLFQIPTISFLSVCFKKVPIYGIGSIAVTIIYMSLWFHLTIRILSRKIKSNELIIVLSILFVYSIIGLCIVNANVSIESMLLTTGGLLLYLDYFLFDNRKSIPLLLLFLFGSLIRVSSGVLVLIAFTGFYLILFRNIRKTFDLLKIHWMLIIICLLITKLDKATSDNPGLQIQQFYEYAMQDRGDIVPISAMRSASDSMRYTALTTYFLISDSAQIKLDFIKSVADTKRYVHFGISEEDISHLMEYLPQLLTIHEVLFTLVYLMLFDLAWGCDKKTIVNILAINFFGWLVIAFISMKINIVDHFLLPWMSLLIGCCLLLISLRNVKYGIPQKIIVLMLLLGMVKTVSTYLIERKETEASNNKVAYANLRKLQTLSKTSVPVIWDYAGAYFPTDVLFRQYPDVLQNCIYQTAYMLMYYKFAQKRCLEKFGFSPLDWRSMNITFHKDHQRLRFITDQKMANFLGVYYKAIYGMDFKLQKDYPVVTIDPDNFVYHLEMADTSTR